MQKCLLAIDQGTSSSRAILFSLSGEILALRQKELKLCYPHDGWVEQDPRDIWADTLWAVRGVLEEASAKNLKIEAAGITNQRETTVVWDKNTGEPVYNAIVWQDRRTEDLCSKMRADNLESKIIAETGLLLDPYFSATKIKWILDHVPSARQRAERGELLFGTIDSFLLWNLSGGRVHATDTTNVARTMLYDIIGQKWDDELLKMFGIHRDLLPEVRDNISHYCDIDLAEYSHKIPLLAMAGDQQAALIGQGCFKQGMIKATYGTGCFALMNIGEAPSISENRLLTTIGYKLNGRVTYALEGSIFNAGTAIQFLRDNLHIIKNAAESEKIALSVPDTHGVYFVPAFTGLGAPYWDAAARGIIFGIGRDTQNAHIIRAALEAQAYQTRDLIEIMQKDSGVATDTLRADGGLVANQFMCQFIADILRKNVEIPVVSEATAWGVAALAGVGSEVIDGLNAIQSVWRAKHIYQPQMSRAESERKYEGWKRALERTRS